MENWYIAIIQGLVEGLTEFLPISSTGHLIITGHLLGFTGPKAETFDIVIQLGAILAVVWLFRPIFLGLFFSASGDKTRRFSGIRGLWLLFLTCLPASALGLAVHGQIKEHLFGPITVALALLVGGVMIVVVERLHLKHSVKTLDDITPGLALGIGCFQCLSLWPGFSRSASTIMGGMLLGADRRVAAEYSFIAAVPIMFAATGYDFLKNYEVFDTGDMIFLAIGFLVSFVSAWVAVKGFIHLLKRWTLTPFAIYRFVVAALVLLMFL